MAAPFLGGYGAAPCVLPLPYLKSAGENHGQKLVTEASKESVCNAGVMGLVPGWGRSSGEGNGYPLQYSCLENHKDRGAWQAIVHSIAKS